MPYIDKKDRKEIRKQQVQEVFPYGPGELNFAISVLCANHLTRYGEKYATYNEIIGALECAKLELYRRMVAPYEDIKRTQNGDLEEFRRTIDARDFT